MKKLTAKQASAVIKEVIDAMKRTGVDPFEAVGIVTEACRSAMAEGANLIDILRADDRVMKHLTTKDINELMAPEGYVGTSLNIRSEKR